MYKIVTSLTATRPMNRGKIDTDTSEKLANLFVLNALESLGFYLPRILTHDEKPITISREKLTSSFWSPA